MSAFMVASSSKPPFETTAHAAWPSVVPARHSARSMSPVEIAGMFLRSEMSLACVPLPEPGAPKTNTIMNPLRRGLHRLGLLPGPRDPVTGSRMVAGDFRLSNPQTGGQYEWSTGWTIPCRVFSLFGPQRVHRVQP